MQNHEQILEQIERKLEVVESMQDLTNDSGLAEFFTANTPEQVYKFMGQIDPKRIENYIVFYAQQQKQLEAVERLNFYEFNLKNASYMMLLIGFLSLVTTHLYKVSFMQYLNSYTWLQYVLFTMLPLAFYNILNGISWVVAFKKEEEEEEEEEENENKNND